MIDLLKDKKAIFFDVGYTLDYPASGDWMFINKFYELAGEKLKKYSDADIEEARNKSFVYLKKNHLVKTMEAECEQFAYYYGEISKQLGLGLSNAEIYEIAHDRTYNMDNYLPYPDSKEVLKTLSKTHKLGVISDTWPSIEIQLQTLDLIQYFTTTTYSCFVGTFKPDKRMYQDALDKMGIIAKEAVFIDDLPMNVESAAELGITPILIAANPKSDIEVPYLKIHSLSELLK